MTETEHETETDGRSNHVGPIIFGDETARSQLVDEGEVVTFRTSERTTGETWWRESRTGVKQGDVTVEQLHQFVAVSADGALSRYADLSGFESVEAWIGAIRDLNGDVEMGRLYRVTEGHDDE